ncbi:hypothetical protein [Aeoliella sp. SH292]|uniref:hypothetical protein n=1 Tax=Aeoliella sp. SH292 TaxID=3454464 RepID=UPI003F94F0B0
MQPNTDFAVKKRRILWALFIAATLVGAWIGYSPEMDGSTEAALNLALLVPALWWCFTDADQRGFRLGAIHSIFLVLAFVIAFPVYLFRTRGRAGFRTLGLTVLCALVMLACAMVGEAIGMWLAPAEVYSTEYFLTPEYSLP